MADAPPSKQHRRWRPVLRSLHRDIGYFVVGLTFIYAASGLAVNHIADWEPNFDEFERTVDVGTVPEDDAAAAELVSTKLGIDGAPVDTYRIDGELELLYDDQRQVIVDLATGRALDRGRKPRFFLRVANWLHLNRGKKAWTFVADAYAILLLYLATSGMVMLPGKKGFRGRGWIFVALGILVPAAYVIASGGPS